ncbi:hypothetical protein [Rhodohalobacter halophilus]|uniref:hypothetical protein n=1 Tax=Rhodohalobacter halophilus TaxID=1812810 RepID=UPI00083F7E8A|nr:hypothetical protein [Rhodohalobacter halophilus]
MNFAIFNGLNPVLPVLLLLVGALLSIAVAYYSYSSLDKAGTLKKWTLITLRSLSLLILLLLLFNPYLTVEQTEVSRAKIAVYLDNSQSVAIEKGTYRGLEEYQLLLDEFKQSRDDRARYIYHTFDSEVVSGDTINGTGADTRLNEVFTHLLENEYQFSAAVLFSDGINTSGRNPLFASTELSTPVITYPLGDTTTVRDIAISDVRYNSPVYTNTINRITAEIQHRQVEGEETEFRLIRDGEIVETVPITFQSASGSQIVEFSSEFEDPGFYNVTLEAIPLTDEFSEENNRYTYTVEVLDDKTDILSIAFEIHPDVAAIRNHIATDIQNELTQTNWLGGTRFSGYNILESDEQIDEIDLVILHGLPPNNSEILNRIEELISDTPLLLFSLPVSFANGNLQTVRPVIPENLESSIEVRPVLQSDNRSHSLLELNIPSERTLPALHTYSGTYSTTASAEILLRSNFQGAPTDIPLLVVDETRSNRIAAVNAFGWYRYKLNRQESTQGFYDDLITNLVSWTSTAPDERNLILSPAKDQFTENENIRVRAVLNNERSEPETNAIIQLEVEGLDQTGEGRSYRMRHSRGGNYTSDLGRLPEGVYEVKGTAEVGGRMIGRDEIRITVGRSNIELVNTQRNDVLLRALAENSGGIFLSDRDFTKLDVFLNDRDLLEADESVNRQNSYIRDFELIWFLLVLGLLTAEWILRRSLSLL